MTDLSVPARPATRDEADLIAAIAEDEARQGRPMTPREREGFARGFFAEEYRAEVRRLMALGVADEDDA